MRLRTMHLHTVHLNTMHLNTMHLNKRRIALAVAPAIVLVTAIPLSAAVAARSGKASGPERTYIVILHDQNAGLGARSAARRDAVRSEQAPVLSQLRSAGGTEIASTSLVNAVIARTTAAGARALADNPAVSRVVPNQMVPGPTLPQVSTSPGDSSPGTAAASSAPVCSTDGTGTESSPQLNPEALDAINAVSPGATGAGVTVALIADGLDTTNPDFQRNAQFESSGSPTGSPVVSEVDFSGEGVTAPTAGGEAFLDASSIAAQANTAYDINTVLPAANQIPGGCWIRIQGVSPGANVLAIKALAVNNYTTISSLLQSINYAVSSGAKVLNESFGFDFFPALAVDVTRQADDAAVKAGVTVVVASGDSGSTNTIASPASDPNVISVGASTTLRGYEQSSFGGISTPSVGNGTYVDNNISSISSGGYDQAGGTVDLVAPGDQNWALCNSDSTQYTDCTNFAGTGGADIEFSGGTSEAAPLTSGAAADVIQAYASTHSGSDPSPALVKQILMSSATDIDAPATQQGSGLLNVGAAVKLAEAIGNGSATGGLLVSPGQINVSQKPKGSTTKTISVTNTSSSSASVSLSTRTFTKQIGTSSGSFCMQPETGTSTTPPKSCPANTGTMSIWSGVTEAYQTEHFTVPATSGTSRLDFMADYPYTAQSSVLHVALFEPDGAYAAYSFPQGLADYADLQVANPPAGTWTAVFFTEQNGATAGGTGTTGTVQWRATTWQHAAGGTISPTTLTVAAGKTATAKLTVTSPASAGDTSESVLVSSGSTNTTIPVTIRTVVPTTAKGGNFSGVLTGGNGRGFVAQANFYTFRVPKGVKDIHADVKLANDPDNAVTAYLIDPTGQNLGYSTNITLNGSLTASIITKAVDVYHADPATGTWTLALEWDNAVSGKELSEPFKGSISFGAPPVSGSLPHGTKLTKGKTYTYKIKIRNSGSAPEAYFADPRLNSDKKITLPNVNGAIDASDIPLPVPAPTTSTPFPYYIVPTQTKQLHETLTGSVPVDFDSQYAPGDPDLEGVGSGDSASLTYNNAEISPGLWTLVPDEVGPYPASGAPAAAASAKVTAELREFDTSVVSSTGDLWSWINGRSASFAPVYAGAGKSKTITVKIRVSGATGSVQRGTLYIDDATLAGLVGVFDDPSGDEVAALPFSYKVAR